MRPWRASTPVKFPVGLKFAGAVGAVALGVLTVAVTAGIGLGQLQSDVERLTPTTSRACGWSTTS